MMETLGRWSDRLLGLVAPRVSAAADTCWTENQIRTNCQVGCQRHCSRRCCMLSGHCTPWSCGACFC